MEIGERIKSVREELSLTQVEFSAKIGIGQAALSALEKGIRTLTERNIDLICKEYKVNELWLRTGDGPMFTETDGSAMTRFVAEYGLDALEEAVLREYVTLPREYRVMMHAVIARMASACADADEADAEYRRAGRIVDDALDQSSI